MNKSFSSRLLDFLISAELINDQQLADVNNDLAVQGADLNKILVDRGIVDTERLTEIRASLAGLSYANLAEMTIDEAALNILPPEVANNYQVVCFQRGVDEIQIGLLEPENFKAIEAVNFLAKKNNLKARYFLVSPFSFEVAFKKYQTVNKEISSALELKAKEEEEEIKKLVKAI